MHIMVQCYVILGLSYNYKKYCSDNAFFVPSRYDNVTLSCWCKRFRRVINFFHGEINVGPDSMMKMSIAYLQKSGND